MRKPVKLKRKAKMTKAVHEGDDVFAVKELGPKSGPDEGYRHHEEVKKQRLYTAQEALEVAGLAEKTDENLVGVISSVPADGPSGTLSVVTARRVLHALEGAGYKITK